MKLMNRTFASDNFSAVDPRIMDYLAKINTRGHMASYEGDPITQEAIDLFVKTFGEGIEVLFTPSGTGANILALKLLLERPYEAVVCAEVAHIYEEETGALAMNTGAQIFPIPHENGKVTLETLKQDVLMRKGLDFHSALPRIVSIANATEYGTYYTPEEVREIANFCHQNDMYLHLDGCRLANVVVAHELTLREYTRDLGVDALSFGGAKNGLMSAEAVVMFNELDIDVHRMQKQAMQLVSKMRFISGQFVPYLRNEIWRENAARANDLAKQLADGLKQALGKNITFTRPINTNQIFCIIPDAIKLKLRDAGHQFYDWSTPGEVRFVTSWDNTEEDITKLLELLK